MKSCLAVSLVLHLLIKSRATTFWFSEDDAGSDDQITFNEESFECPNNYGLILPSTMVCDGNPQCSELYSEDEYNHLCAPKNYLLQNLTMYASNTTNTSTVLEWSSYKDPKTMSGSSLKFAGYLLTARSLSHNFKKRVNPELTSKLLSGLRPWTEYNVTLRRFYTDVSRDDRPVKLGRAAAITIKTDPSSPGLPKEVVVVSTDKGKQVIHIRGPDFWNGSPSKYRLRWEPQDPRRGSPGYKEIYIASAWVSEEKLTTANLTLEPGVRYKLYVSAQNSIGPNVSFQSPEFEKEVATVPLDPVDIVAESLTPTEVVVCWRSSGPAEYFEVFVKDLNSEEDSNYISSRPNLSEHFHARVVVDGGDQEVSEQSLIIDDLLPARNYKVEVLACTMTECSGKLTAEVITKPAFIPEPTITRVASNVNSFVVGWTFPGDQSGYYDGFQVRHCRKPSLCKESYTYLNLLNVSNLSPDTTYDVQVRIRIKHTDGRVEMGPVAKVQVKTWSEVPKEPGLDIRAPGTSPNTVILSWAFINSSVTYIQFLCKQYRDTMEMNYEDLPKISPEERVFWTNCSSHAGCSASVIYGWTPSFKTGFLRLRNLKSFTAYDISVRGCNDVGCGNGSTLRTRTSVSAPSVPVELKVSRHERDGALVDWKRPVEPAGHIDGYIVARSCPPGERLSSVLPGETHRTIIKDLPLGGSNCTFWVTAFNTSPEGHLLLGRTAEASLP